jgi:tRNA nucleotidyltransferase/poly(A) polymerase
MNQLLPENRRLRDVCLTLAQRPEPIYLVGGYVRDWLLGRETHDLDFAVDGIAVGGTAIDVARWVANRHGGAFVLLDREHDTARAVFRIGGAGIGVDFAGLRGDDIEADLRARDFTVNAMAIEMRHAIEPDPPLIDPTGGRADLQKRTLRAASPHALTDDPLRALRAVRQSASLHFRLDPSTRNLIREAAPLLDQVARERIQSELMQLIALPRAAESMAELDALGLLAHVLPDVAALGAPRKRLALRTLATLEKMPGLGPVGQAPISLAALYTGHMNRLDAHMSEVLADTRQRGTLLRLIALLTAALPDGDAHSWMERIMRQLRFSGREIALAVRCAEMRDRIPSLVSSLIASCSERIPAREAYRFCLAARDAAPDLVCLHVARSWAAGMACEARPRWQAVCSIADQLLGYWRNEWAWIQATPPLIDGKEVMSALELPGGPVLGRLLAGIREAQALGEIESKEKAQTWAQEALASYREESDR